MIKELEALEKRVREKLVEMGCSQGIKDDPIYDGVVDIAKYLKSTPKMLWILKEPWETPKNGEAVGGWSLTQDLLAKGNWNNRRDALAQIAYITYSVFNGFTPWDSIPRDSPDVRKALLRIALINVKTFPNVKPPGKKISYPREIRQFYSAYKDVLLDQVRTIAPDVIIGGNTLHLFLRDVEIDEKLFTPRGSAAFYKHGRRLYIKAYHPALRKNKKDYFDDIVSIIKSEWHN